MYACAQVSGLERQQEEAVEAEDFEAAAALDAEIAALQGQAQALQEQLKQLEEQVRRLHCLAMVSLHLHI